MDTTPFKCALCGHTWIPKHSGEKPERCPKDGCRSKLWDKPNPQSSNSGDLPPQVITQDTLAQETTPQHAEHVQPEEVEYPEEAGLVPHAPFARNPDGTYNPKPMWARNRRLIREYEEKGNTAKWQRDFRIWFKESYYLALNMPYFLEPNSPERSGLKNSIKKDFNSGYELDGLVDALCDDACKKPEPPAPSGTGSPEVN